MTVHRLPVTYPFGNTDILILRAAAGQGRIGRGDTQGRGGWFASKEVASGLPTEVANVKAAYKTYNAARVKLAKRERLLRKKGIDPDTDADVLALRKTREDHKAALADAQDKAKGAGFNVNNKGVWRNEAEYRADGGQDVPKLDPVSEAQATVQAAATKRDSQLQPENVERFGEIEALNRKAKREMNKERKKIKREDYDSWNEYFDAERAVVDVYNEKVTELNKEIQSLKQIRRDNQQVWQEYHTETTEAHGTLMQHYRTEAAGKRKAILDSPESETAKTLSKLEKEINENSEKYWRASYESPERDDIKENLNELRGKRAKIFDELGVFEKQGVDPGVYKMETATYLASKPVVDKFLTVDDPATIKPAIFGRPKKDARARWNEGFETTSSLVSKTVIPNDASVGIRTKGGRASADSRSPVINIGNKSNVPTVIHEVGHKVEDMNSRILDDAVAFVDRRTEGEREEWLGGNYRRNETAKKDKFINPYMGKTYKTSLGYYGTEVISMGLEYMATDPVKLAQEDPDYFDFIYAVSRAG